jgi:hypothetical protein
MKKMKKTLVPIDWICIICQINGSGSHFLSCGFVLLERTG